MQCINRIICTLHTIKIVSNEVIYRKGPVNAFLNQLRHISPAFEPSKGCPFPCPTSYKLKGTSTDLVTWRCYPYDTARAPEKMSDGWVILLLQKSGGWHQWHLPAAVGTLKCSSHNRNNSSAVKGIVHSPFSHLHNMRLHRLIEFGAINSVCRTKSKCWGKLYMQK